MIIYPAPICGASGVNPYTGLAGTAGAQIAPDDATYGSPSVAESCYDGASGPPSALLTNVSSAGGTIFMGSNPIDAAGGTALTIMAGPGFNWTGGVGNGEADVDTGTAGLNKQAWGSLGTTATIGSSSTSPVDIQALRSLPRPQRHRLVPLTSGTRASLQVSSETRSAEPTSLPAPR